MAHTIERRIQIETARIALLASAPLAAHGMLFNRSRQLKAEPLGHLDRALDSGKPLSAAIAVVYERMTGIPLPAPWTVMLLPPDTIQPHCTDPFMVHVTAVDRSGALEAAIAAACREYMIGEADMATMEPSDWKLLLLCRGHIVNLVDAGG